MYEGIACDSPVKSYLVRIEPFAPSDPVQELMIRSGVLLALLFWLTACSTNVAENERCRREAPATASIRAMPWGYYPGYGCGPIPPQVSAPFG